MYGCTLYLTSALDEGGRSTPIPGHFPPPRERDPIPICTVGWVGHRAGQDGCGKCVNVYVYMCVMLTRIFETQ